MALIHAELGELETASAMVEQLAAPGFRKFRHDMLMLPGLAFLTLVCAKLGDPTHAEEIYDLMRPYRGRVVIVGAPAQACWGAVDHYLGVLATLTDRPEWATDHFEAALATGARLGAPALLAETRLELGNVLAGDARTEHRDRAGDAPRLGQTHVIGTRPAAVARPSRRRRTTLIRCGLRPNPAGSASRSTTADRTGRRHPTLFAAARWRILDGDHPARQHPRARRQGSASLGHAARLSLVDRSMSSTLPPGVLPLVAAADSSRRQTRREVRSGFVDGFGDAGEVLDDAAKDAYRSRLAELDDLISEAERFNDIGRASQLGVERDLLVDQLTRQSASAGATVGPCR